MSDMETLTCVHDGLIDVDGTVSCLTCGRVWGDPEEMTHVASVAYRPASRYPWLPECSCGQGFRGYVAKHAAQGIADAHAAGEYWH